jgi:acylphosphatase
MKHFNIIVMGKVQGVFYRQSAKETAAWLGVNGFVSNEPNGTVYIEAEGTEQQLIRLVEWCRKGPANAAVSDVKVTEGALKNFSSFEIRR